MARRRWLWRALIGLAALFVVAQLVPYGHDHTNPPVRREAPWPTPEVRELAARTCYGCHSNATVWPWYSWVAPVSWLVQSDVAGARGHLNFSEWDRPQKHARDAFDELDKGDMPPWIYTVGHSEARLDAGQRALLLDALKTLGGQSNEARSEGQKGREEGERDDD